MLFYFLPFSARSFMKSQAHLEWNHWDFPTKLRTILLFSSLIFFFFPSGKFGNSVFFFCSFSHFTYFTLYVLYFFSVFLALLLILLPFFHCFSFSHNFTFSQNLHLLKCDKGSELFFYLFILCSPKPFSKTYFFL